MHSFCNSVVLRKKVRLILCFIKKPYASANNQVVRTIVQHAQGSRASF